MNQIIKAISIFTFFSLVGISQTMASKSLPLAKVIPKVKISKKQSFKIEVTKSSLNWKATKLKGEHVGTMNFKKGKLIFSSGDLIRSDFEVDMGSIIVTDIKDPKWNLKLVNHLNGKDFFDTKNHKIAKFKTKSIMTAKGGGFDVMGTLTIKGIDKPANFKIDIIKTGTRFVKIKGKLTFDRTHYGITYNSGNFFKKLEDKLIHDPVHLTFNILAKTIL